MAQPPGRGSYHEWLYFNLNENDSSHCRNHDKRHVPYDCALVEVNDPKERNGVAEKRSARSPEQSFRAALTLTQFSRTANSLETHNKDGQEKHQRKQPAFYPCPHVCIDRVPHIQSPIRIVPGADQEPLKKPSNKLIDQFRAVPSGSSHNPANAVHQEPNRGLHCQLHRYEEKNGNPSNDS